MPGNSGNEVKVMYKIESVFGTPVSGGSGEVLPVQPGSGLSLARALIEDPTIRSDGMTEMARHGPKSVAGSYPVTLRLGALNTILAAIFRTTWVNEATALTCDGGAAFTSLATTTGNTLTLVGTGSFLTQGVRVGDVIRASAMGAGVDNVNAVVATVAANVITVLGTPWTNITADANAVLKIAKKLKNGATLTNSSYTIEEQFVGLDESELFAGCRFTSLRLTWGPSGVVNVEVGVMGQNMTIAGTAASPNFTTPTEYTSIGLVAVDGLIYVAGVSQAVITGGSLTFDLQGTGEAVVGSQLTPDIWLGQMSITGEITAIRTALTASKLAAFLAETDNVELSLLFVEPDAAVPIDFLHVFLPRLKYFGNTKNLGGAAPVKETLPIRAGKKTTATGYDEVMATISTSV